MKKSFVLFAVATLFAAHAFATYWVIMKDGSRYVAKAKPTINGNRATIVLQSGSTLVVDATQIDMAKSEEVTRNGGGELLAVEQAPTGMTMQSQGQPLGSKIKLRKLPPQQQQQAQTATPPPQQLPPPQPAPSAITATPPSGSDVQAGVIDKFTRAFENVGIFEHKLTSINKTSIHCDLTADSEEKVFQVLSAAAFLVVHNAGVQGAQIDMVEIFMKTTNGGVSGRFQMTQADAQALYAGGIAPDRTKLQDYFVRKVLF